MVLNIINNAFHYEAEKLSMAFFPEDKIRVVKAPPYEKFPEDEKAITVEVADNEVGVTFSDKKTDCLISKSALLSDGKDTELCAAQLLYNVLTEVTGVTPGWGILTGVRPSKLMNKLMCETGEDEAKKYFVDELYVSPQKTELAVSVAKAEQKIMSESEPDSFSLYVSIPFCPGRCSYCSFVSSAVNTPSAAKLIPVYFEKLLDEIKRTAEIADKSGIKMLSAYIGGGTPSILSPEQTDRLLKTINSSFDKSGCKEFTFEAGRPDTITDEKLAAVAANGIGRISINPQTMSDEILRAVGRRHSAEQVYTAFEAARKLGFDNINMDLIAGLPGDTPEGFDDSLEKITGMSPESVTVHTLAYKRSSDLSFENGLFRHGRDTSLMVDSASRMLYNRGYIPYYMYRQTKSVGNLENVGWCKPGYESRYNVYMMEECHTILSCGAGAVTKIVDPDSFDIERIFNFKYPYEYNDRFEELLKRKDAVLDFYDRRNNGRI